MHIYIPLLIFLTIFVLSIDVGLWYFIKRSMSGLGYLGGRLVSVLYWFIPVVFLSFFGYLAYDANGSTVDEKHYYFFTIMNGLLLALYVPKGIMLVYYAVVRILSNIKKSSGKKSPVLLKGKGMTRAQFMGKMGVIVGAIPFAGIMYSITKGRFRFSVNTNDVAIKNLPSALKGFRVVQLSDLHLGNFNRRYELLDTVIEHINSLNADLIVLTGDLVNNFSSETVGWDKVFERLKARYGKYAILGNHDYGDYSEWKSETLKRQNFEEIKAAYRDFGFKLLLNSHEKISVKGEDISLIGVENWGNPPFARYGKLDVAMQGKLCDVKILLTHDPDHWEAEVLKQTNIDLTLSGHTHGMQMGVKIKNMEWSPAQWKYKYWGGLYQADEQYLYVNRGLGCVGVPLRIGMPPEVTLLTLV